MAQRDSDLTLVSTVADELEVDATAEAARLERYVAIASAAVVTYLNRGPIHYAEVTELLRGNGRARLHLPRQPVAMVLGVQLDEVVVEPVEFALVPPGIIELRATGWADGREVRVDYRGGWMTPVQLAGGTSLLPSLPLDIEHAVVMTAVGLHRTRGADPSLASESYAGAAFGYRVRNTAIGVGAGGIIPDAAMPLLAPWRKVALP